MRSKANPIEKTGQNLKYNKNVIEAIKYAGFDCVTLANNHFMIMEKKESRIH